MTNPYHQLYIQAAFALNTAEQILKRNFKSIMMNTIFLMNLSKFSLFGNFKSFFTTKKGTEDTGLGLSISNDIIKAHGGDIIVESQVGRGTTFIISIQN